MTSTTVNYFDTNFARGILLGLQYKLVYLGSADPNKRLKNRAKNKVAGKQRQVNRKNGSGV